MLAVENEEFIKSAEVEKLLKGLEGERMNFNGDPRLSKMQ